MCVNRCWYVHYVHRISNDVHFCNLVQTPCQQATPEPLAAPRTA